MMLGGTSNNIICLCFAAAKVDCRYWTMFAQYSLNIWLFRLECWMEMATSLVQWHGRWKRRQASENFAKKPSRVTSRTATGDVKLYLGDIFFFYGTIWFTQIKSGQGYLYDFHELSTGIKSCF